MTLGCRTLLEPEMIPDECPFSLKDGMEWQREEQCRATKYREQQKQVKELEKQIVEKYENLAIGTTQQYALAEKMT